MTSSFPLQKQLVWIHHHSRTCLAPPPLQAPPFLAPPWLLPRRPRPPPSSTPCRSASMTSRWWSAMTSAWRQKTTTARGAGRRLSRRGWEWLLGDRDVAEAGARNTRRRNNDVSVLPDAGLTSPVEILITFTFAFSLAGVTLQNLPMSDRSRRICTELKSSGSSRDIWGGGSPIVEHRPIYPNLSSIGQGRQNKKFGEVI